MKFGKNLLQVVDLSPPDWVPFWMDYKTLKKRLKGMAVPAAAADADDDDDDTNADGAGSAAAREVPTVPAAPLEGARRDPITANVDEIAFFRHLMAELRKTVDFYKGAEIEFSIRMGRIREGVRQLQQPAHEPKAAGAGTGAADGKEAKQPKAKEEGGVEDKSDVAGVGDPRCREALLRACVRIYKDLLLLENYSIMSYCGFSKILKKHDKLTGYVTRQQYMSRVVNPKPFSKHERVVRMVSECEELFERLTVSVPAAVGDTRRRDGTGLHLSEWSEDMRTRLSLRDEEQLFIDAIRNLNTDASTMMRAEKAEVEEETKQRRMGAALETMSDISTITASSAESEAAQERPAGEEGRDAAGASLATKRLRS